MCIILGVFNGVLGCAWCVPVFMCRLNSINLSKTFFTCTNINSMHTYIYTIPCPCIQGQQQAPIKAVSATYRRSGRLRGSGGVMKPVGAATAVQDTVAAPSAPMGYGPVIDGDQPQEEQYNSEPHHLQTVIGWHCREEPYRPPYRPLSVRAQRKACPIASAGPGSWWWASLMAESL